MSSGEVRDRSHPATPYLEVIDHVTRTNAGGGRWKMRFLAKLRIEGRCPREHPRTTVEQKKA